MSWGGVIVLGGVEIWEGSIVQAGSVVVDNIPHLFNCRRES